MLLNLSNPQTSGTYTLDKDLKPIKRFLGTINPDHPLLEKTYLVITSCATKKQIEVACKYLNLVLQKLEYNHKPSPDLYRELRLILMFFTIHIEFTTYKLERSEANENL